MRFCGLQRVGNGLEWVESRSSNGRARASGGAKEFIEKKSGVFEKKNAVPVHRMMLMKKIVFGVNQNQFWWCGMDFEKSKKIICPGPLGENWSSLNKFKCGLAQYFNSLAQRLVGTTLVGTTESLDRGQVNFVSAELPSVQNYHEIRYRKNIFPIILIFWFGKFSLCSHREDRTVAYQVRPKSLFQSLRDLISVHVLIWTVILR